MDTELAEHPDSLPSTGRAVVKQGHRLALLSSLTKDQQKAIPADAPVYAKPNCRKCFGKGFRGMVQASIRKVGGRVEVIKPHRNWCRCIQVVLPLK